MQRCVYYSNKYNGPCPKERCTKMSIAAPTPTTAHKRFRIILTEERKRTWGLALLPDLVPLGEYYKHIEGYYSTGKSGIINSDLGEYLHVAKERYQLSDYNVMQLLGFFKYNITLARLHLGGIGSWTNMQLELDSPWRIGFPSITQQSISTIRKNILLNPELVISDLPPQKLFMKFASRSLRIQRTHHDGLDMWVLCALPEESEPFIVDGLLMPPFDTVRGWLRYKYLKSDIQQYLFPILLASKSSDDEEPLNQITFGKLIENLTTGLYSFLIDITTEPIMLTSLLSSFDMVSMT